MSVTGICSVCGAANARSACDRCGNVVCGDHYDEGTGLCSDCASEVRGGRGHQSDAEDGDRGGDDGWSDTGPTGPR